MEPVEQRRLYEEGLTIAEVAERAGQSVTTTRRRLLAAGTPMQQFHAERHTRGGRTLRAQRGAYDDDQLAMLAASGMSTKEIGAILGKAEEQVRRAMVARGIPRLPAKARRERNVFWRGGAIVDKHGYILIHSPDHPHVTDGGYVRQHRLVMEQVLGRLLTRDEVVDHIDGDTSNNDPENLRLFPSNAAHLQATRTGSKNVRKEVRALLTQWAIRRATVRVIAIRQASESGAGR